MSAVSLGQANRMIEAAFAKAQELQLKPLTVSVLDSGGHLLAMQRQDGSSNLRPQIAAGKAKGALALGISSRAIADMAADRPTFVAALGSLETGTIVPAAGGVIFTDGTGAKLGAIGVTGDTSDNDELCAFAGIEAAGLIAL